MPAAAGISPPCHKSLIYRNVADVLYIEIGPVTSQQLIFGPIERRRMVAPAEHLEEAAIADLSRQLAAEGYDIVREARSKQQVYDLVARKNGRKIAL